MKINRNTIYSLALLSLLFVCQIPTTLARAEEPSEEGSDSVEPLIRCIESIYYSIDSNDTKMILDNQKYLLKVGMKTVDSNGSYDFYRELNTNHVENDSGKEGDITSEFLKKCLMLLKNT